MMDERLAVRICLRLRPLQHCRLLRWALCSAAALALALPLLLFAPPRLARLVMPLHIFPLPTMSPLAGLAVDPVLDRVFVTGAGGSVWTLDGRGGRLLGANADGEGVGLTGAMGVDAVHHRIYVAMMAGGVEVLDGTTGGPDVPLPFTAVTGLAVDTSANRLFLSQPAERALTVVDATTRRVLATLTATWVPGALAVDQTLRRVYVADVGSARLAVLDADSLTTLAGVDLGFPPIAIAVDPGTHRVYVADPLGAEVTVLAGATGARRTAIPVGRTPSALAINPATQHLFVTNADDDTVSVVDTRRDTVVATVPVGRYPVTVAVNARTGRVYVANSYDQSVSVLEHDVQPLFPLLAFWRR
ncbi:MAG: YncE family protein [Chloroflexota bacterium]